jgi:hypothetical protein
MVKRGGAGEPYCSDQCCDEAGIGICGAFSQGIRGICGFCQSPVRYGPTLAVTNCVAMPHKGRAQTLFICTNCRDRGKEYLQAMQQCCMCGRSL